ncbi:MAG TPA: hypothetical protein PKW98_14625, partial [Candidatus Wallbacteria bacterium]|nr:hypothetical protein [Candidatus Wallbacteria bacterium]
PKLQQELDKLEKLKYKHYEQLELFTGTLTSGEIVKRNSAEEKKRKITRLFDDFIDWMEDTMCLEKDPYIQIIAAFSEVC